VKRNDPHRAFMYIAAHVLLLVVAMLLAAVASRYENARSNPDCTGQPRTDAGGEG